MSASVPGTDPQTARFLTAVRGLSPTQRTALVRMFASHAAGLSFAEAAAGFLRETGWSDDEVAGQIERLRAENPAAFR